MSLTARSNAKQQYSPRTRNDQEHFQETTKKRTRIKKIMF